MIEAGESVTIPAGRTAVLPNIQVDGTLTVDGDVFIPSGATNSVIKDYVDNKPSGFKNYIINGGFDVWQRGVIFTGHETYYADRWLELSNTNDDYTVQKIDLNSADISATGHNKALVVTTTAGTTGTLNDLRQRIEFPERFYNKTLTLSFWYKSDTTASVEHIRILSSINGVSVRQMNSRHIVATPTWQKASYTFTVTGIDVSTLTSDDYLDVIIGSPVGQTTNYYVTGVQLEEGSVATPFEQRPYGLELSLCQRYYQGWQNQGGGRLDGNVVLSAYNDSTLVGAVHFPVETRVIPTVRVRADNTSNPGTVRRTSNGATTGTTFAPTNVSTTAFGFVSGGSDAVAGEYFDFQFELDAEL